MFNDAVILVVLNFLDLHNDWSQGLVPNLLRVVPATMITFVVYENVSHYLLQRRADQKVTGVMDLTKKTDS